MFKRMRIHRHTKTMQNLHNKKKITKQKLRLDIIRRKLKQMAPGMQAPGVNLFNNKIKLQTIKANHIQEDTFPKLHD